MQYISLLTKPALEQTEEKEVNYQSQEATAAAGLCRPATAVADLPCLPLGAGSMPCLKDILLMSVRLSSSVLLSPSVTAQM